MVSPIRDLGPNSSCKKDNKDVKVKSIPTSTAKKKVVEKIETSKKVRSNVKKLQPKSITKKFSSVKPSKSEESFKLAKRSKLEADSKLNKSSKQSVKPSKGNPKGSLQLKTK